MRNSEEETSALVDARVGENQDDLVRYFQRRLAREDAADAFGETLLTVWRLRKKLPADQKHARMWLFQVARNVLLNYRRAAKRRSAATTRLVDELRSAPPVQDTRATSDVKDAIEALPAEQAELIRLIYWDGFKSHEAALVLGLTPSTVRSRLSKAKTRLRELLEDQLTFEGDISQGNRPSAILYLP